jgi:ATP synthase protein I
VNDRLSQHQQHVVEAVRRRAAREREGRRLPALVRDLGRVGVLGWQIVVPGLIGVAIGRWLDHRLTSGIFWTAALLVAGLALGCWSAWRWVRRQ